MNPSYKTWILDELESWAETFNNIYPEYMEQVIEDENNSYNEIHSLIDKLNKDQCSKEDYENILFHIWQIKNDS
jgi:endonuclease III-like uncharacterized protein